MAEGNDEEKRRFAREILAALQGPGTFIGNPNAAERVNHFAQRVKDKLDAVMTLVGERGLDFREVSIQTIESLMEQLESAMNARRNAQVGGAVGNVVRIGGAVFYATPIGQAAFWSGLVISGFSDSIAKKKGNEIEKLAYRIRNLMENDRAEFRLLSGSIRQLDDAIQEATGCSLYDDEFNEFLRVAAEIPDRIVETVENVARPEIRNTIIDIAQNRRLIDLLQVVYNGIRSENLTILNVMVQSFNAISVATDSITWGVGLQFAELAIRGLVMFKEYKLNQKTLQDFKDEVHRLKKEYKALEVVLRPEVGL